MQQHPPRPGIESQITFLYYKDLPRAAHFYGEVLGLELAIDQGFAKIFRAAGQAYVGVVDEQRGYHRASPNKPVEITMVVRDVDAWYAYLRDAGITTLTAPRDLPDLGIRMFLLEDPEGYTIEMQKFCE